jgi:hypothetical protein
LRTLSLPLKPQSFGLPFKLNSAIFAFPIHTHTHTHRSKKACIIFFDEVDAIGGSRTGTWMFLYVYVCVYMCRNGWV